MPKPPAESTTRPYLDEASSFRALVEQWREDASRARADLQSEVDRLETEIQARLTRIGEQAEIVSRCDAALGVTLAAPVKAAPAAITDSQTRSLIDTLAAGRPVGTAS